MEFLQQLPLYGNNWILCSVTLTWIILIGLKECALKTKYAEKYKWYYSGIRVVQSLVFCVVFGRSNFVLLTFVLSVHWFAISEYPFGTSKLFFNQQYSIYIDYYMAFFISYPLLARGHDISLRADRLKGWYMNEGW